MRSSRNTLIIPTAAMIALVSVASAVLLMGVDQVGIILPLIGTTVLGLMSVVRGEKAVEMAEHALNAIEEIHKTTNSKMDLLIREVRKGARAEGRLEGMHDSRVGRAVDNLIEADAASKALDEADERARRGREGR